MNILLINTLYSPMKVGGAEVSVQLLAEELVIQGNVVSVACVVPKKDAKANSTRIINGVNVYYIPLINLYWPFDNKNHQPFKRLIWHLLDCYNPFMIRKVKKLLRKIRPDVVHTNNLAGFSSGILSLFGKSDVKLIHTARDYYFLHPNCTLMKRDVQMAADSIAIKLWAMIRGRYIKNVDWFVGISEFIRNEYTRYNPCLIEKSSIVYNPVDKPKVINNDKKNDVRDTLTYGFIGRLSPEKGFEDFVKLAHTHSAKGLQSDFCVAGKGENGYVDNLLNKYPKADICFLGFVDPSDFYSKIDILVLPSKWPEPFGRTFIEAAQHRVHIVGYPKGGLKELFTICHNISYIVNGFDELLDFSFSINRLNCLELPKDYSLLSRFSPAVNALEYTKLYLNLIEINKKPK